MYFRQENHNSTFICHEGTKNTKHHEEFLSNGFLFCANALCHCPDIAAMA